MLGACALAASDPPATTSLESSAASHVAILVAWPPAAASRLMMVSLAVFAPGSAKRLLNGRRDSHDILR